jgi:Domain of unknown function (DUF1707)
VDVPGIDVAEPMPAGPGMRSIDPMTENRLRASDAERERTAKRIQDASAEGRLSLDETEDRLGAVYAAKYVDELSGYTADLPPARPPYRRFPPPLRVHAAIVATISILLIVRWLVSGIPFFWPVVPMFWLGMSLVAHYAIRSRRRAVPY